MMLMPLTASVVLVRDEADLEAAFTQRAPYLFHTSRGERSWDQGLRSFTCSRRIDAFKVWVALQRHGASGIAALYDHLCDNARTLHALVASHRILSPSTSPSRISCASGSSATAHSATIDSTRSTCRPARRYNRAGTGWITTTVLGGRRVLRVTLMNPRTTPDDVVRVLDCLSALAT